MAVMPKRELLEKAAFIKYEDRIYRVNVYDPETDVVYFEDEDTGETFEIHGDDAVSDYTIYHLQKVSIPRD